MQTEAAVYERIVLKLSGEALQAAGARENISPQVVLAIAERIKEVRDLGVQIGVVIGGGNIWRGTSAAHRGMDRTTADYMGMLATVINGLALQSACAQIGVETRVQTAIEMKNVAEPFIRGRAIRHLELGRVKIFYEQRRHSSRSRNGNGKKRRFHGARIRGGADRESIARLGRECGCASLRLGHETQTACPHHHARTALTRGATIRRWNRARHRESTQRVAHRHNAVRRLQDYSPAYSGIVGGTPQRSGPFAWQDGGRSARASARESARCPGRSEKAESLGWPDRRWDARHGKRGAKIDGSICKINRRSSRAQRSRDHESVSLFLYLLIFLFSLQNED